jgi:hypothetical protein
VTESAGGVPAISDDKFSAAPGLLVLKETDEFGPPRVGDGASKSTIGEHPVHVEILDDEPIVSFDQRGRYLMQKVPTYVCDVFVVAPQLGCGCAVAV